MKLKDICEINPRTQGIADYMSVSFVPMPCVSEDGKIDTSEIRQFIDVKKGYTVFQENDVLFAKITPCMENGKGAIARGLMNGIGCGSSEFHVLRANNEMVCPEWIYYLTAWSSFRREAEKHMTGSAGQRRVPKAYLENYDINVPSLPEQTKQTEVLSQLQQIIDCRKEELQKLDELVKARFVELFGDTILNPFGWKKDLLGTVCDVRDGTHDSPQYYESGYPLVTSKNVTGGKIDLTDCSLICEADFKKISERSKVDIGDIIMPMIGTVGKPVIVDIEPNFAIKNVSLIKFKADSRVLNIYIRALLQSDYFDDAVLSKVRGGTQKFISLGDIRKLEVLVPPMELQEQFATFIKQTDKSKVVVQKALDEAQTLFESLMQQYFG